MCVCDETGVCPPGCRYRPGGTVPWSGHDRYQEPTLAYERTAEEERYERQEPAADGELIPW